MNCPKCGVMLSEKNFCTACGEEVGVYKKVVKISNSYYNDGLEKARIRDLSGAIESLKRSLKYYKKNIMARNLLGLVYYEMGEVVEALSHWVVSVHYQQEKNIAEDYLKSIQSNPGRLDTINQTIRKFNQALIYCNQGSEDLAIIQLKKVLNMNNKMIQAYQLLGLIYISNGEYEQARKTLNRALKIDTTNTRTIRYLRETRQNRTEAVSGNGRREKIQRHGDKIISYQDGNEMIIQPMTYKESTGVGTLVNILIGLVIGLAVAWFLIFPARQDAMKSDYKDQNLSLSEELTSKEAEVSSMRDTVADLTAQVEGLQGQLAEYETDDGTVATYEALIQAANAHLAGDGTTVLAALNGINPEGLPEAAGALYQALKTEYGAKVIGELKKEATNLYKKRDYVNAVAKLKEVLALDANDVQSMYYLARSYQEDESLLAEPERTEQVKALLSKIIELEPNGQFASYAKINMPQ